MSLRADFISLAAGSGIGLVLAPTLVLAQTAPPTTRIAFNAPIITSIVGGEPADAALGDFNGDTLQDIAVVVPCVNPQTPGVLVVLLADPANPGSFLRGATITVGLDPTGVAVGDFDGKNGADIVVVDGISAPSNVQVFLNTGPGEFLLGPAAQAGVEPSDVAVADFNRDGLPDVVVANRDSLSPTGSITVLFNQGGGLLQFGAGADGLGEGSVVGFGARTTLLAGQKPKSVCPADVDGDGDMDILALNAGDANSGSKGSVSSYANTPGQGLTRGVVAFIRQQDVTIGLGPRDETVADLNGDGRPDIVVAEFGVAGGPTAPFGDILAIPNISTKPDVFVFDFPRVLVADVHGFAVAAVDLDFDGDPDLPIITGTIANPDPVARVLENRTPRGQLGPVLAPAADLLSATTPRLLLTTNVDGDNDADVLTVGTEIVTPPLLPLNTTVAAHPNASFRPEDVNRDHTVGPGDLLALLASWGKDCTLAPCPEDIDGSGVVGPGDLLQLLSAWGQRTG